MRIELHWMFAGLLALPGCAYRPMQKHPESKHLIVKSLHSFGYRSDCQLARADPDGAIRDVGWTDRLTLEAASEGTAELFCQGKRLLVHYSVPSRLEIGFVTVSGPFVAGTTFFLLLKAYAKDGRDLEVGEWTPIRWSAIGAAAMETDRSAGEFGICPTCYGHQRFRALKPGKGIIRATLDGTSVSGEIGIEVRSGEQ